MKHIFFTSLFVFSLTATAAQQSLNLPSCDIQNQQETAGETGGQISDPGQAHISVRANVLSADISTSRKGRGITEVEAQRMVKRVENVRNETNRFVEQQGFLSAAEKASFDREFDAIAMQLCR
ncbi:hypothetical protein IFT47_18435 [Pseudomonas sp. CFBP 13711]|uniref:hypothetical protein n=1 Tax=unclassified Pseudomonas TaxID=196821 RepID=UPI00177D8C26|nr:MULTISPECIES: hypothetical protein [unclassified Pseudomonas]MBD8708610.1 hypothetical protein [Pseudomonas sp. CFBP 13711]MBD8714052.1 hypothetical protein [Pseudomonas sp. CFBP 13715]